MRSKLVSDSLVQKLGSTFEAGAAIARKLASSGPELLMSPATAGPCCQRSATAATDALYEHRVAASEQPAQHARQPQAAPARRAVLLIHLGMPDGPDVASVRRYLAEVLSDPAAIPLPHGLSWIRPTLGRILALSRAPRCADQYRRIWTDAGAPPAAVIQQQVLALQEKLPTGTQVFCAMRYGRPSISETLRQITDLGIEELVVIPMYPQYSGTTTWTAVQELYRQLRRHRFRIDVTMRSIWYNDAGYINAQAQLIHEYASANGLSPDNTHLLYSVHSPPASWLAQGDPYVDHIRRTAELVTRRLGYPPDRTSLCYESRPEQTGSLRPTTAEVLAGLSRAGERQVLVCPLSFTTDSLDMRADIQICREQFEQDGGRFFACPALNAFEPFVAALRNLALHGRHTVCPNDFEPLPSLSARPAATAVADVALPLDSLVMVGMSLGGRLGPGRGPAVAYTDANQFRNIKKARCELSNVLRSICDGDLVREGLLWNTCRRFEFYGWLNSTPRDTRHADAVSCVRDQLFNHNGHTPGSAVNILCGADAWHYLLRTAAGLNSGLPGEREVLEQLHAAQRLAERAGTAGRLMDRLLADISHHQRRLREQTDWGRYAPDHCYAAIWPIVRSSGLDLPDSRCLVIGGSTTSCGILDTLAEHFGVARQRLTLVHRGHSQGGHLKLLRKAIGNGRRIRVNRYDERIALRAIAEADVTFFGLDSKEPVLDAEKTRALRDFSCRPLAIFDFNLFGSTLGLQAVDGVRLWHSADLEAAAAVYAEEMCGTEQFARAARAAESWICDHLPKPSGARRCVSETD
jgi:ferrochelatase